MPGTLFLHGTMDMNNSSLLLRKLSLMLFVLISACAMAIIITRSRVDIDDPLRASLGIRLPFITGSAGFPPHKAIRVFVNPSNEVFISGDCVGSLSKNGADRAVIDALERFAGNSAGDILQEKKITFHTTPLLIFADKSVRTGRCTFFNFVNIWLAVETKRGVRAIAIPSEITDGITPASVDSVRKFFVKERLVEVPDRNGYLAVEVLPDSTYGVAIEIGQYCYSWSRIFIHGDVQHFPLEEIGEVIRSRAGNALVDISVDYRVTVEQFAPLAAVVGSFSLPWAVSYEADPSTY